jgi:hypothetical protein
MKAVSIRAVATVKSGREVAYSRMVSMDLKTLYIGEEQERYGRCR